MKRDELEGLITACAQSLDHDTPIEVLADWLEDTGEARVAQRLRRLVRDLLPRWQTIAAWPAAGRGRSLQRFSYWAHEEAIVTSLGDTGWRLPCLGFLASMEVQCPPRLDLVPWQDGWDACRFRQERRRAEVRVMLAGCGWTRQLSDWYVETQRGITSMRSLTRNLEIRRDSLRYTSSSWPRSLATEGAMHVLSALATALRSPITLPNNPLLHVDKAGQAMDYVCEAAIGARAATTPPECQRAYDRLVKRTKREADQVERFLWQHIIKHPPKHW